MSTSGESNLCLFYINKLKVHTLDYLSKLHSGMNESKKVEVGLLLFS